MTQPPLGPPILEAARHLAMSGFHELSYQEGQIHLCIAAVLRLGTAIVLCHGARTPCGPGGGPHPGLYFLETSGPPRAGNRRSWCQTRGVTGATGLWFDIWNR